eukprot:1173025-Pleurochrysis_carterae.AAC.6
MQTPGLVLNAARKRPVILIDTCRLDAFGGVYDHAYGLDVGSCISTQMRLVRERATCFQHSLRSSFHLSLFSECGH